MLWIIAEQIADLPDIGIAERVPRLRGLAQLRREPAYRTLAAVRNGRVYGLFPYNSYSQNFEAIFANAYYAGTILYPERFADVEPMRKAEDISRFLNNGPAFAAINERFANLAFRRIPLR